MRVAIPSQNAHGIKSERAVQSLTLAGPRVELRLMVASDAPALLSAASDGQLWNLKTTVIPSSATIDSYLTKAAPTTIDLSDIKRQLSLAVNSFSRFNR